MRSFVIARGLPPCSRICHSAARSPGLASGPTFSMLSRRWATTTTSGRSQQSWHWQSSWKWYDGGASRQRARPSYYHPAVSHRSALATTATFVALSGEDVDVSHKTGEERMLEASRAEISNHIRDDEQGLARLGHSIILFLDSYVWEPLCTSVRILHLALIFVPVLLAIPVMWVGRRQHDRDNERSGTLWWYGFLVQSMEWAGPAFIKVRAKYLLSTQDSVICTCVCFMNSTNDTSSSWANGPLLDPISSQPRCAR